MKLNGPDGIGARALQINATALVSLVIFARLYFAISLIRLITKDAINTTENCRISRIITFELRVSLDLPVLSGNLRVRCREYFTFERAKW